MIGNTKYYLGGYDGWVEGERLAQTSVQMYSYERKIQNTTINDTTINDFYSGTNPNSWVGKVTLMYVSDYGYASSNCENKRIWDIDSSSNDIRACNTTNWLYNNANQWLLPQYAGGNERAFLVVSGGNVSFDFVNFNYINDSQHGVRPVLYLISSVQITGGNGTSSSPYTLGL